MEEDRVADRAVDLAHSRVVGGNIPIQSGYLAAGTCSVLLLGKVASAP